MRWNNKGESARRRLFISALKVAFIERRAGEFVSIENVFRDLALKMEPLGVETSFHKQRNHSTATGWIKNLLGFRMPEADLFHITGDIHYMALALPKDRTLLTVHDLRFLHRTSGIRRFVLKKLFLDWPVRRMRFVTACSEATREEICSYVDCSEKQIYVVDHPVYDHFVAEQKEQEFDREKPRILQVGTAPQKNVANLVRALEGIECHLVLVGRPDPETAAELERTGLEHSVLRDLSDREMVLEYEKADIATFCSTFEGFGMPVVEAQGMLTPVVASDISPVREVAGEGACLADPYDPGSIRSAIIRLRDDSVYRDSVVQAGKRNIERFRSGAIASEYVSIYRHMLEEIDQRAVAGG